MMNKKEFEEMPIDELKRLMVGQLTKIMLCIKNGEKNTYEYGDSDSMPLIARIRMIVCRIEGYSRRKYLYISTR